MSSTSLLVLLDCPECLTPSQFEAPPCADEHDPCPEVVCLDCGTALLLGAVPAAAVDDAEVEIVYARTA
jgi:hypothetical protein